MKKYTMETTVGIFLALGLAFVAYMTITLGHFTIFGAELTSTPPGLPQMTAARHGATARTTSTIKKGSGHM